MNQAELAKLIANYQPNPDVLTGMAKIKVLSTVGPSATGKTSIMKQLMADDPSFDTILVHVSRSPRSNEQNRVDYLFRSLDELIEEIKAGQMVQAALGPNGDIYCTKLDSYPTGKTGLIALVPPAVVNFHKLPIAGFAAAFVVPDNFQKWMSWFEKQAADSDWDEERRHGRLTEAKASFEFALSDPKMHFLLNDNLQSAAARLKQVAEGQMPVDEAKARQIAEVNYQELLQGL